MIEKQETMSVQEAARYLEVDPSTITRAIKDGRLHNVAKPPTNTLAKRAKAYRLSGAEIERYKLGGDARYSSQGQA